MTHALEDSKREKKLTSFRSNGSHMFFKIGVLKNFPIFAGTPVFGVSSCNFNEKRLQHKCFPVNIAKNLKVTFLYNSSGVSFSLIFNSCLFQEIQH